MKNIRKSVRILLAIALLCATLLTGCSDATGTELAVVSACRNNSASVDPGSTFIRDTFMELITHYGTIRFITVEGKPKMVEEVISEKPDDFIVLSDIQNGKNKETFDKAIQAFRKTKATTAEADPLAALRVAAESFSDKAKVREILMIDSMIPTTGEGSFLNQYCLNADPEVIVSLLRENKAIPDLSAVDEVTLVITDVENAQEQLSDKEKANLTDIWQAILKSSGAKSVKVVTKSCTKEGVDHSKLPAVSPVMTVPSTGLNVDGFDDFRMFTEEELSFVRDSTKFTDPVTAAETLKPVIKALQSDKKLRIVIGGTAATVLSSSDKCRAFSLRRANAVKALIVKQDKTLASRIQVKGLGYNNDFHVPDMLDGHQIETEAQKNRLVIIADVNSDKGKQIIAG